MKTILICLFATLLLCISINAQTTTTNQIQNTQTSTSETKPKKSIFRATKAQVMQAQKMLKITESGKLSGEDKDAVKAYQSANGLKSTGGLNRATLEKMGIALTDKQKEIPISANSFATDDKEKSGEKKKRGAVFKATKDQINQAQKMLKMTENGKLDDTTRESLKTYQQANGIKSTGTLNKITLEKMGIGLTDKQKEM